MVSTLIDEIMSKLYTSDGRLWMLEFRVVGFLVVSTNNFKLWYKVWNSNNIWSNT